MSSSADGLDAGPDGHESRASLGVLVRSRTNPVSRPISFERRAGCERDLSERIRWCAVMRATRFPIAVLLIAAGGLLAIYGALALVYQGDGSGPPYVTIAGNEMNAHLAGGMSLAIGAVLLASGLFVIRRRFGS